MGRTQFRRKDEIIKFFHIVDVKRGLAFSFEEGSVNLEDKCFLYIHIMAGKETILGK